VELARFAYESSLNRMWPRLLPIIARETRPAVPLDYLETAAACEASTTIPNKYFTRIARFDRDVFNDPCARLDVTLGRSLQRVQLGARLPRLTAL